MEDSLRIMESLRTKVSSDDQRSSYFATVHDYYSYYIEILMQLHKRNPREGYDRLALEASERGRARTLLEVLSEAHADVRTQGRSETSGAGTRAPAGTRC